MARPKHPDYQQISVRLPLDVLAKCRSLAARDERSLNEQVVFAVKRWLEAQGPHPQPDPTPAPLAAQGA